jgi:AcrR family transcriptional regulator
VPKLWESTVEGHRDAVRAAIARATGELAHRHGVTGVTMSAIAREAGISRATLYRYASDTAEAVDLWRTYQIDQHLQQLQSVAEQTPSERRLDAVLERYVINLQHGDSDVGAVIPHHGSAVTAARSAVSALLGELILAGTVRGDVRTDIAVDELLIYTMSSLEAATYLPNRQAAVRLANLVAQSLRPSHEHRPQAGEEVNGVP